MPSTYTACAYCGCQDTDTRRECLSEYGMGWYYEEYAVCANCGTEWVEAEWCSECGQRLDHCDCDRCDECGELIDDCSCADRCAECHEWTEDCRCEKAQRCSA
ncbi:hypothetical protein SAMN05421543_10941 [Alicyclobacillus macrosporangiidus]|uniref:Uncharacterized protein n=1 Tax=Alicyclobacillus macrosporangiidus TaxID=392015 RepID=A0A1I7JA33_9BACL|nr:hypothetical protein SAMN05421543_10941 [Alicyclobacillus macrosporangiidus]